MRQLHEAERNLNRSNMRMSRGHGFHHGSEASYETLLIVSRLSSALGRPSLLQQSPIDLIVAAQTRHPAELVDQHDRVARGAAQRYRRAHLQIDRRDDDVDAVA